MPSEGDRKIRGGVLHVYRNGAWVPVTVAKPPLRRAADPKELDELDDD